MLTPQPQSDNGTSARPGQSARPSASASTPEAKTQVGRREAERGSWPVKPGIRYKKSCGFNGARGRYPVLCLPLGARVRLAGCMMWGIEHGRSDRREAVDLSSDEKVGSYFMYCAVPAVPAVPAVCDHANPFI